MNMTKTCREQQNEYDNTCRATAPLEVKLHQYRFKSSGWAEASQVARRKYRRGNIVVDC